MSMWHFGLRMSHGSDPKITTYCTLTGQPVYSVHYLDELRLPTFWSTSADFPLAEGLNNAQCSDRTMKSIQQNPQTNALTKPRSPTQPSNQRTHQTTQSNWTLKPMHSPNHAVTYEGTLTQITYRSIHCHWIRNANRDLLHCSVTRVCSVSLLSESVTRSR